ncbi:hypothetical protein MPSEU_000250800 [Mayamaea pseudoterrestris]|nr:hypothetical protein MPSEU_000250800 [Mayamaea pseudoterrestris]
MNKPFRMDPPPAVIRPRKRDLTDNDSQSQLSDESSAIDSSRAVAKPRRKRQRTFLNAFSLITLQRPSDSMECPSDEDDDADSSKAVADEGDECGYSVTSSLDDDLSQEDRLLSDKEEAERKVMLELVFGPETEHKDIVDAKLEGLIRKSLQKATTVGSVDDMDLETSYQRSSDAGTVSSLGTTSSMKRSSSLPSVFEDSMDVDMMS